MMTLHFIHNITFIKEAAQNTISKEIGQQYIH